MVVGSVMTVGVELVSRAFFLVTGYFLARLAMGAIGNAFPQVAGLGNFGIVLFGIGGAIALGGVPLVAEMMLGAAMLGTVNVVDGIVTPAAENVAESLKITG